MRTLYLLLAQYDGKVLLPAEVVCRDFFPHLGLAKLLRKIGAGEIALPLIRMDKSQKTAKFVALAHLAAYVDAQMAAAEKEARQLADFKRHP